MIVGGYAVAFHGFPRFTKDIDIFYLNSKKNVNLIIDSLCKFGFSRKSLPIDNFLKNGGIISFGVTPIRVDFINEIDGIKYLDAKSNIVRGKYGDIKVSFISKNDLVKNKSSTNLFQDKVDLEKIMD